MVHRLIGFAVAGAVIAVSSSGARGSPPPSADSYRDAQTATTTVAFAITVPAKSQAEKNPSLQDIARRTRSASLTVVAEDGTPTTGTTTVDCSRACTGSVSIPFGKRTFIAKLFDGKEGQGRLLAIGAVNEVITARTKSVPLTFNTVVASVQLALEQKNIFADPESTTHLLITARDAQGAVIVGPGYYMNQNHQRIAITITNSAPNNTSLSQYKFEQPIPSDGVSNVATIKYRGRAHFDFPTFTVANPGLTALPAGGVTLTYVPNPQDVDLVASTLCVQTNVSVGGFYYGGSFFAIVNPDCIPWKPDILQISRSASTYVTYEVNPHHDSSDVQVGFGSDKRIYFSYTSAASSSQTVFGYIVHPLTISSANLSRVPTFIRGNAGSSWRASAKITSVSALTLGNDGSLWFSALWNGKPAIGKLPPAGLPNWGPQLYAVPNAGAILSVEPGIGDTEALLYTINNKFNIATIGTNLSGFRSFPVLTGAAATSVTPGDLLAGPLGSFYVGAVSPTAANVYRITSTGALSTYCANVAHFYRLSDGTGFGSRDNSALVHVVPGQGCLQVPDPADNFMQYDGLFGVDSTTPDWILYTSPNGHRGGIF